MKGVKQGRGVYNSGRRRGGVRTVKGISGGKGESSLAVQEARMNNRNTLQLTQTLKEKNTDRKRKAINPLKQEKNK